MKLNKMCPFCFIKQIFTPKSEIKCQLNLDEFKNESITAPPMGWSSWNTFYNTIDQNVLIETAKAMRDKGLINAGYKYLNIDDNWISSYRTEDGKLQGDFATFSKGIPQVISELNSYGVKVGLYTSNGTNTCEDLPSSLGHESIDAKCFADWGAEYFKYDYCHNIAISTYAPLIYGIKIAKLGSNNETFYDAKDAKLEGAAKFMHCNNKKLPSNGFVSGLDRNSGSITFDNVQVSDNGQYVLTLLVKKHGQYEKFAIAEINNKDYISYEIPSQKKWNITARFQKVIKLNKGANTIKIFNPVKSRADSAMLQYRNMGNLLYKSAKEKSERENTPFKPITFSICEWGKNKPWEWGKFAGNLWRTTPDIRPSWPWMNIIYERNVRLYKYASCGHYNDPDMLEVGNGNLTYNQNKTHFALWCMMNAPLILGNDLRSITDEVLEIVTNKTLIQINQDPLNKQAKRIRAGLVDILVKPLSDNKFAIQFYNKTVLPLSSKLNITNILKDKYLGLECKDSYKFTNVYTNETMSGMVIKTPKLSAYESIVYIVE